MFFIILIGLCNKWLSRYSYTSNFSDAKYTPLINRTCCCTITSVSTAMVGLGNVDTTFEVNKPISTSMQRQVNTLSTAI